MGSNLLWRAFSIRLYICLPPNVCQRILMCSYWRSLRQGGCAGYWLWGDNKERLKYNLIQNLGYNTDFSHKETRVFPLHLLANMSFECWAISKNLFTVFLTATILAGILVILIFLIRTNILLGHWLHRSGQICVSLKLCFDPVFPLWEIIRKLSSLMSPEHHPTAFWPGLTGCQY